MEQIYNVIIIGAGNIGAFFDGPDDDNVLSHAHAFKEHEGFNLLGFIDIESDRAKKAASIWGGNAYKDIEEAFNACRIDVAVVTVPDEYHYSVLKKLSRFPLRVVFTEKPIARTLNEAEDINRNFREKNIGLVVNYSRRFVPEFEKIKKEICEGAYGAYLTGTGYYGKGIIHNGSHLIDLLMFFIGDIKEIKPLGELADFYEDDKSVSAVLAFEDKKQFFLQYVDCRKYTLFEIDLLFERKRVRIFDLGFKIEEYDVQDSKVFNGYRNIVKTAVYDTSLKDALYNAAENIYKNLTDGQSFKCTAEDGYKALKTCIAVKESVM